MAIRTDGADGAARGAVRLIACPAVRGELEDGAADGLLCETLDVGLHRNPDKLGEGLRAAVGARWCDDAAPTRG